MLASPAAPPTAGCRASRICSPATSRPATPLIDEAAVEAGRDPRAIRRLLNLRAPPDGRRSPTQLEPGSRSRTASTPSSSSTDDPARSSASPTRSRRRCASGRGAAAAAAAPRRPSSSRRRRLRRPRPPSTTASASRRRPTTASGCSADGAWDESTRPHRAAPARTSTYTDAGAGRPAPHRRP